MSDILSGGAMTMAIVMLIAVFCYFFFADPHSGNIILNSATDIYRTLTTARTGLGM